MTPATHSPYSASAADWLVVTLHQGYRSTVTWFGKVGVGVAALVAVMTLLPVMWFLNWSLTRSVRAGVQLTYRNYATFKRLQLRLSGNKDSFQRLAAADQAHLPLIVRALARALQRMARLLLQCLGQLDDAFAATRGPDGQYFKALSSDELWSMRPSNGYTFRL